MSDHIFFEKSQKVFKMLRIWCSHKKLSNTKLNNILKSWALIFSGCSMGILCFLDLLEAVRKDLIDAIFSKLLFLGVCLVLVQKVCTVTYTEKKIIEFINLLKKISLKFENKTDLDKAHGLYKKIYQIGIWAMNVSVFFFMMAPVILFQKRILFFQPKIAFLNMEESPNWELMFIFQAINAFVLTNITLAYDTIYCGMLGISAAALRSISREIREIDEVIEDHQKSESKMKNIIEKIIEISEFTERMSDLFAMTSMVHIVYICGTIALGLYVISMMSFKNMDCFTMVLAIMMSIFLLWIYCYFGQILVDERRTLQTELYFLNWYDASKNVKIMILVSMTVLQKDHFVCAGKIIPLSMETFGQVLTRAYTFFTFMNDIKNA